MTASQRSLPEVQSEPDMEEKITVAVCGLPERRYIYII